MSEARTNSATKRLDPITFEVLRHKLDDVIAEAYYTMGRVSGSAVVYEAGDHQEAICTASGDAAVFGAGVLHWVKSIGSGVRHVVSRFSDNPGIFEGDQFIVNDPYVASVHAPDLQLLAPVIHEGRLIAWAGAASHQPDIGGAAPGGLCISATEVYQEGFQTGRIKLVERGVVRRDVEETIANMVRAPELGLLEFRAKIAANNIMKTRILELVERYGPDTVTGLFDQVIEYSEQRVRSRLNALPDGVWTSSNWIETASAENLTVEVALRKEGDELTFDFTGSSPQSHSSFNIGPVGAASSAANPFIAMLCHDIPWNEGLFKPLEFVLPERSIVNPARPAAVSSNCPTGANMLVLTACQQALSNMLLSNSDANDESCGNSGAGHNTLVLAGADNNGQFFTSLILDGAAGGGGGHPQRDGEDTAQNPLTVKAMIANVETVEMLTPVLYTWRSEVLGSGGAGKHRGGMGLSVGLVAWGAPGMAVINVGCGVRVRNCLGYAGGVPAPRTPVRVMRGADMRGQWFAMGRLPSGVAELVAVTEHIQAKGETFAGPDDVVVGYLASGGGGFGDPLDRDPELIACDYLVRAVDRELARAAYGVELDAVGHVDPTETQELRSAQREDRLARMRVHEPAVRDLNDIPGIVVAGGELRDGSAFCRCGAHLGHEGAQVRLGTFIEPLTRYEPAEVSGNDETFVLEHLGCPACGLLFSVELAEANGSPASLGTLVG